MFLVLSKLIYHIKDLVSATVPCPLCILFAFIDEYAIFFDKLAEFSAALLFDLSTLSSIEYAYGGIIVLRGTFFFSFFACL